MKKIDKQESYNMGREAYVKGLPGVPTYNKEFWELNNVHEHEKWKENIDAYAKGWFDSRRDSQNVSREILARGRVE